MIVPHVFRDAERGPALKRRVGVGVVIEEKLNDIKVIPLYGYVQGSTSLHRSGSYFSTLVQQ